jgi:hypothetical protein
MIAGRNDVWFTTIPSAYFAEMKISKEKTRAARKTAAEGAVRQVFEMNYALGNENLRSKKCFAVGVVFSSTTRLAVALLVQEMCMTDGSVTP